MRFTINILSSVSFFAYLCGSTLGFSANEFRFSNKIEHQVDSKRHEEVFKLIEPGKLVLEVFQHKDPDFFNKLSKLKVGEKISFSISQLKSSNLVIAASVIDSSDEIKNWAKILTDSLPLYADNKIIESLNAQGGVFIRAVQKPQNNILGYAVTVKKSKEVAKADQFFVYTIEPKPIEITEEEKQFKENFTKTLDKLRDPEDFTSKEKNQPSQGEEFNRYAKEIGTSSVESKADRFKNFKQEGEYSERGQVDPRQNEKHLKDKKEPENLFDNHKQKQPEEKNNLFGHKKDDAFDTTKTEPKLPSLETPVRDENLKETENQKSTQNPSPKPKKKDAMAQNDSLFGFQIPKEIVDQTKNTLANLGS